MDGSYTNSRDCRGDGGGEASRPIWTNTIAAIRRALTVTRVAAGILLAVLITVERVFAQPAAPPGAFSSAAETVLPAVIAVTIPNRPADDSADRGGDGVEESPLEGVLKNFFGDLLREPPRRTVAAGVILDASGLALTSAHGLLGASDVEAATADGSGTRRGLSALMRRRIWRSYGLADQDRSLSSRSAILTKCGSETGSSPSVFLKWPMSAMRQRPSGLETG